MPTNLVNLRGSWGHMFRDMMGPKIMARRALGGTASLRRSTQGCDQDHHVNGDSLVKRGKNRYQRSESTLSDKKLATKSQKPRQQIKSIVGNPIYRTLGFVPAATDVFQFNVFCRLPEKSYKEVVHVHARGVRAAKS